MTDADKRAFVASMYSSPRWKTKVSNMSDAQVFAIWAKEQQKLQETQAKKNDKDDIPF